MHSCGLGVGDVCAKKVLIGLQMQLQQLDGKFDEIGVRGLTGESPLRSRRRHHAFASCASK